MKVAMELMDILMAMRSENSRILTRSAKKRIEPVHLTSRTGSPVWTPCQETDPDLSFAQKTFSGTDNWDLKLPALDSDDDKENSSKTSI